MTVASGQHGHLDVGFSLGPLWLRVLLLGAVLSAAAFAMLRGFLGEPDRRTLTVVLTAAFSATALELLLSGGLAVPEQAVPFLLAALVVPLYLALSTHPARATMVARARRFALWLFWPAALIAAARFGQAWLSEQDPVLLHTGVVFGLVAVAWFAVARPRERGIMTSRVGAGLLAIGLVGGVGQAIVARPADPTPGLASTTTIEVGSQKANVVVVPNLPGWNLVHVDAEVAVGTDRSNLASPTGNGWLPVRLPAGRAELLVSDGRDTNSLVTNTGTGTAAAPPGLTGPNGPECANALLGRMLVTGALTTTIECPAEALTPADAKELTTTVERLAQNGTTSVALLTDESPRARSAAETIRATAAALGMNVVAPDQSAAPLVVVSGAEPESSGGRMILAPWLRSTMAGTSFQQYVAVHRAAYPTLAPSMAGFQAWLSVLESLTAP